MAARACPSGVITVVKLIRRDDDGNIVEESDADQPTLDNGLSVMAVTIT